MEAPSRRSRLLGTGGLVALAVVLCSLTVATFFPGFMSYDTLFQLKQAQGQEPLSDWHPPVMSLLWRALIAVTGTVSTMATLQIVWLWVSLLIIALVVHRLTASFGWGAAVLGLGVLPQVVTIVGVVWKDVHLAVGLLSVAAIAMVAAVAPRRDAVRWPLMALTVVLLVYVLLVRKNGIVAIVPMLYLVYRSWYPEGSRRALGVYVLGFVVAALGAQAVITAVVRPQASHVVQAVALDDVLHVVPESALRTADLSPDLRDRLLAARERCEEKKSLMNTYWTCVGRGEGGDFTPIAGAEELIGAWPGLMAQTPGGYLQYRAEVFAQFMFNTRQPWQEGVLGNEAGIEVEHPRMVATLRSYVLELADRDLPFVFGGWFWLLVACVQTLRWRAPSRFGALVGCLGASSLLYVLAYVPTAPATDYRYVYWPAIAGSLGLLVMLLDRRTLAARPAPSGEGASRVQAGAGRRGGRSPAAGARSPRARTP